MHLVRLEQSATGRVGYPSTPLAAPPRVLLLATSTQPRGAESFAVALAEGLESRGLQVRLRALTPATVDGALPMTTLGVSALGPATLLRLRREILWADLVVACGSTTLPASVVSSWATGRPVIYQNIGDPVYWANTRRRRLRVRFLLRRTAAVAAITEESAARLHRVFGVPRRRLQVLRNGRDTKTFRVPSAREVQRAREELSLSPGQQLVATIGALSPEKRVDVAISAIGALPTVQLLVVGEGPCRSSLERHAASVAPGRVLFLGNRGDVRRVLQAVDAVVLTSESEGVPGVLIEAGLCGRPVVATDVGFVSEVVADGVTGKLVPPDDPAAVAQALREVLVRRQQLGSAARAHCASRFDLERVCDEWAELIRGVVGGGRRRG
jgi:glycosyltransferase involved in cell wall biosynthesis